MARLAHLANKLDSRFSVLGIRFGYDSILGLIPGIGDVATTVPAAWIVFEGHRMGARPSVVARMAANTGIDFVVGGIPLIGDLFDVGFKANRRNIALLRRELEKDAAVLARRADERRTRHG
ncbi:DUF4112 domain-containing protein [Citreimonas salinaria]|uniref:DUF4112 domain-containing protein n=1 Tax=Citreimonas salinaria TaxID=321339 RepID=A0A1H3J864_9RHOB|nr:DUF4112 domain-containing protein [Citreimonas salinaria]SDY35374.1 protein of unknown function [Citreimonas salinaria]